MPRTLDPRIVILDIDEKSLNAEGRWPWSRDKLALMVKQLFDKYQIRVLGFDIAFAEADPSSGLASLEELAKGELKDDAEFQAFLAARARLARLRPALRATRSRSTRWCWASSWAARPSNRACCPPPVLPTIQGARRPDVIPLPPSPRATAATSPVLQKDATAAGHLYPALDIDGVTRRVPMLMQVTTTATTRRCRSR